MVMGELCWVDLEGKLTRIEVDQRYYSGFPLPRLSRADNDQVVLNFADETNLWVYDFGREGGFTQLFSMAGNEFCPVWEPRGKHIAFTHLAAGTAPNIYWNRWDGSGSPESLYESPNASFPTSFSPDGSILAFTNRKVADEDVFRKREIWLLSIDSGVSERWSKGDNWEESGAEFSPNGKWIAYVSDESGKSEVYVRQYPEGRKMQVSMGGGGEVVWGPQGKNLFYRNGEYFMRVVMETEPEFKPSRPEQMFKDNYLMGRSPGGRNYDISRDGNRFLMIKPIEEQSVSVRHFNVVVNWFEELERLLPTKNN